MNIKSAEDILAICAAATVIGGVFLWITRLILAPFKLLVSANTKAMEKIESSITKLTDKLDDHGDRLTMIETKHAVRHDGE